MQNTRRVTALGFFDGVHLGHQALMRLAGKRAQELDATAAVITFDAHPDKVVRGVDVPLLESLENRKELIERVGGIRDITVLHFDSAFMRTPWEDFVRSVVDELGAVHLVVGRDFCCGWKGLGTAERIAAWCGENGVGCDIVEQVELDGVVVSSTHIRSLVADGRMEEAARFLGHPYSVSDRVIHGYQRGRRMGIPTINFPIQPGVIVPRHGVYAGDRHVTVETHLLEQQGELYGARVRIELLSFLRDEARFDTQQALAAQIMRDIDATRRYFQDREGDGR